MREHQLVGWLFGYLQVIRVWIVGPPGVVSQSESKEWDIKGHEGEN